jgi:hypothetical protein
MKQLQDLGYTENGMGGAVVCKLNYADYAGERVIEIRDFDENDIWLYYDYYVRKIKYRHCSVCNRIITYNKNENTKYCEECRQERNKQDDKKYNLKR